VGSRRKTTDIKDKKWQQFEKDVAKVFSMKGLIPTGDIKLAGRQNDVMLKSQEEHIGQILVECKYLDPSTDRKVGVVDVEGFAARVL